MVGVYLSDIQYLVDNHIARFQLVLTFNFGLCHIAGARDILVEIVGVSGADVRNIAASLRKSGGVGRVSVHNALDVRKRLIQNKMRRGVTRRIEVAFDNLACLQIDNNHIRSLHCVVIDARRFDDNQPFFAVDARDVAPRENHKSLFHKVEIGLENFLFQIF